MSAAVSPLQSYSSQYLGHIPTPAVPPRLFRFCLKENKSRHCAKNRSSKAIEIVNKNAVWCAKHGGEQQMPRTRSYVQRSKASGDGSQAGKPVNHNQSLEFGILSISAAREDHNILRNILHDSRWRIVTSRTCKQAIALLCRRHLPVVICESDLPDGTWRDVLDRMRALTNPPVLIVTSRLADDYLWAEVLNLGGYNVFAKPFRETEVKHVVATLWMQEHGQFTQTAAAAVV
jgi:putative hemolysin